MRTTLHAYNTEHPCVHHPQDDAGKYGSADVPAKVCAILSPSGFVDTTDGAEGPFGVVLDKTSFYAESGAKWGRS
jgi:alanyl-tRNA synthetase